MGDDLTQNTFAGGIPTSIAAAKVNVFNKLDIHNSHIVGFGMSNLQDTEGGAYNWTSLDKYVDWMRATGKPYVITLCRAPPWMTAGGVGGDIPPTPANFSKFATLSGLIATRYSLGGAHPGTGQPNDAPYAMQVWNEMKGFWDSANNRWDAVSYTNMYNLVYAAVRAANPKILLGGPYALVVPFSSANTIPGGHGQNTWNSIVISHSSYGVVDKIGVDVINYFVGHATGYDFICFDLRSKDGDTGSILGDPVTAATDIYADVTTYVKSQVPASTPIWISELHVGQDTVALSPAVQAAATTAALEAFHANDGSVALLWGDEGGGNVDTPSLWTDTAAIDGGQATAVGQAVIDFISSQ